MLSQERDDIAAARAVLEPALRLAPLHPLLTRAEAWFTTCMPRPPGSASDDTAAQEGPQQHHVRDLASPRGECRAPEKLESGFAVGEVVVATAKHADLRQPLLERKVYEGPRRGAYYDCGPVHDMTDAADGADLSMHL